MTASTASGFQQGEATSLTASTASGLQQVGPTSLTASTASGLQQVGPTSLTASTASGLQQVGPTSLTASTASGWQQTGSTPLKASTASGLQGVETKEEASKLVSQTVHTGAALCRMQANGIGAAMLGAGAALVSLSENKKLGALLIASGLAATCWIDKENGQEPEGQSRNIQDPKRTSQEPEGQSRNIQDPKRTSQEPKGQQESQDPKRTSQEPKGQGFNLEVDQQPVGHQSKSWWKTSGADRKSGPGLRAMRSRGPGGHGYGTAGQNEAADGDGVARSDEGGPSASTATARAKAAGMAWLHGNPATTAPVNVVVNVYTQSGGLGLHEGETRRAETPGDGERFQEGDGVGNQGYGQRSQMPGLCYQRLGVESVKVNQMQQIVECRRRSPEL